jgi:hypothetical protein
MRTVAMTKLLLGSFLLLVSSCASADRPVVVAAPPRAGAAIFHPAECSEAPQPPIAAAADSATCELER